MRLGEIPLGPMTVLTLLQGVYRMPVTNARQYGGSSEAYVLARTFRVLSLCNCPIDALLFHCVV